jgi:magnesium transporter
LHPLTLEDILQQEPREKFDLFPRLGYYFVSFSAIETREGRENSRQQSERMNEHLEPIAGLREGAIGETYVYLVVFSDGICCVRELSNGLLTN